MSIDLTGRRFGRLTVLKKNGQYISPSEFKESKWDCKCICGSFINLRGSQLRCGITKSCGCLKKDTFQSIITKHGYCDKERLYKVWDNMRSRCYCKTSSHYSLYGGRGIKICEEWNDYIVFRKWALQNGYSDILSLDRIDFNGDYRPDNCRWVTFKEQQNNKASNHYLYYNGEKHTISEWSEIRGINYYTLRSRIRYGWNVGRALNYE